MVREAELNLLSGLRRGRGLRAVNTAVSRGYVGGQQLEPLPGVGVRSAKAPSLSCLAEAQAPCGTASGAGGSVGMDSSESPPPASSLGPC